MNINDIKQICVIGAGNMGHQIALRGALSGYKVICTDVSDEQLKKAEAFADKYLPGRVAKGKLTEEQAKSARENISFSSSLEEAARDADFVIEAATEKMDLKLNIFSQLDNICKPDTILATNSSFIVSSKIAGSVNRPDKVVNMHFFNPALVMKLVEVVKGPHVSQETADVTMELARRMEKKPVLLKKEIYGFLVNYLLASLTRESLYLLDQGIASAQDIDMAVENALGHPMGPFKLMDLTGVDLSYHISMERFLETGERKDMPSPTIVEKYVRKEWGKKTGKGFYEYNK
ncbi:3-hydroxyacyl-CoA dehydrogenase family protein [Metallumcola ferriviriculae]|uniref:3-hydroxybutyryl-CoA dehydrogenase n=1 Tax=Metallumcola ferriviriculae TaxID=3039180 RepID=A0AAU0UP71_9FIRM|nr:3-hydroxyacyl-CoA dehydrogenase family protein [Desulfitibacteraceae bacterium MK1]